MLATNAIEPLEAFISHFSVCKARIYSLIYDNSHEIYDKQLLKIKAGNQAKSYPKHPISIALSWTEELIVVAVRAIL